jgi:hypothetical protein
MLKTPTLEVYSIEGESVQCPNEECARTFTKPLKATMKSEKGEKTYYACPYCLTEIKPRKQKSTPPVKNKQKENSKPQKMMEGCSHYLGYLKERPKNTPIPEECLLCTEMVQCLLQ